MNLSTEMFCNALQSCGKTQKQVSDECGFNTQNMVTMLKQGRTKIPPNRAKTIAQAVGLDEVAFVGQVLMECYPSAFAAVYEYMAHDTTEYMSLQAARRSAV